MKYLLLLLLLFDMNVAFSEEKHCIDKVSLFKGSTTVFNSDSCRAGDALEIMILSFDSDYTNAIRSILSKEISELCDLKYPVTVLHAQDKSKEKPDVYAICRYVGYRRIFAGQKD